MNSHKLPTPYLHTPTNISCLKLCFNINRQSRICAEVRVELYFLFRFTHHLIYHIFALMSTYFL